MSRKAILVCLAVLLGAAGCQRRCFVATLDLAPSGSVDLPQGALGPAVAAKPLTNARDLPPPATVDQPTAQRRYLSLAEAVAVALEHGTVGLASPQSPGFPNESLVTFQGGAVSGSDAVRVLALDPARFAADIEAALSRFDARWISS